MFSQKDSSPASSHAKEIYLSELDNAGMIDNPACRHATLPSQNRLAMLREREDRWLYLDYQNRTIVSVPPNAAGLYKLSLGVYMLGRSDGQKKRPGVFSLPLLSINNIGDKGKKEPEWSEFNLGKHIIDFGTAHEEHDLTAFVVGPLPTDTNVQNVYIHLMQHSTHKYHPLTFKRILDVHTPGMSQGDIKANIRISGDNLAVVLEYPLRPKSHSNSGKPEIRHELHVWNWKTASSKIPATVNSYGIVFLRDDLLLQTNTSLNTLDIYYIPPWVAEHRDPHSSRIIRIGRLHLPELQKGYHHISLQVRSDPPFSTSKPGHVSPTEPFYNDPNASIILLRLTIRDRYSAQHSFKIIAHRKALLVEAVRALSAFEINPTNGFKELRIPWDDWGPRSTRWIPVNPLLNLYITASSGARAVCLKDQGDHIDLEVYDFLETRLDRFKSRETPGRRLGPGPASLGSTANSGPKANEDVLPPAEVTLVDHTSPTIIPASRKIFVKDVKSHLPYIRTCRSLPKEPEAQTQNTVTKWFHNLTNRDKNSKPQFWDWKGVIMDQQHIIGVRLPREGNIFRPSELDVLYFG